jgi:hypothetical protein
MAIFAVDGGLHIFHRHPTDLHLHHVTRDVNTNASTKAVAIKNHTTIVIYLRHVAVIV